MNIVRQCFNMMPLSYRAMYFKLGVADEFFASLILD